MQFTFGSIYAWSVFNQPVDGYIYENTHEGKSLCLSVRVPSNLLDMLGKAPLTYAIMFCFCGVGALTIGPWLERYGPRPTFVLGTFCFVLGHFICGAGVHYRAIALVYLGYGVLTGCGAGMSYITCVSVIQKWYPDHRGGAVGLAVAGLGIGTVAYAKIRLPVVDLLGVTLTFAAEGTVHCILLVIATWIMRVPPPGYTVGGMRTGGPAMAEAALAKSGDAGESEQATTPTAIHYALLDVLVDRDYRLLYWLFLAGSLFNVVVASRLPNIAIDVFRQSSDAASTAVSVDGAFSILGRVLVPLISDYTGRKSIFIGIFSLQLTCIVLLILFIYRGLFWPYMLAHWLVTACFGGGVSLLPPMLAELFGDRNVNTSFGSIILVEWGVCAIGCTFTFTAIYSHLLDTKRYTASDPAVYAINYVWLLAICCTETRAASYQ
ncbi:major facilitator superfamily domain-containing protein [Syncephalis pseudoplumigaleata]|uniref:Major facilitator superfamily domain-containing protein n=1 Tax=Syncephalis pseudoplumigaleata TaxID=1712513 RepID=A0A4P9Z7E6_9FUNG|nr:major facilitator superfamily domain-containing protein [Syncephalis pseudoplumigaleata]|eukprot:RKP28122.1 major facilitator superfamily domain-containing protein [Syncephalis pseudoplumigaleata]